MIERTFGPIRLIPGENNGKYPFCHSVFVEEAGILIDPGSDRKILTRLKEESAVRSIWLTHWHEDHFTHLDLFEDLPLFISEADAPMLSDMELFLDGYGVEDDQQIRFWREILLEKFHFKPRTPTGFLQDGQRIELGGVTAQVLLTPGHTPGHLAFYFEEPGVLFLGDYDLTKFGPWYGDRASSIPETIASVRRLRQIPATVWLTSHGTGVFEEDPGQLWENFLGVIEERENRLIDFLNSPRTLEDIVNAWIAYRKSREPKELYAFAERAIMSKHIDLLKEKSLIVEDENRYVIQKTPIEICEGNR
jgi:hydroxyacylglutathione hydrolase